MIDDRWSVGATEQAAVCLLRASAKVARSKPNRRLAPWHPTTDHRLPKNDIILFDTPLLSDTNVTTTLNRFPWEGSAWREPGGIWHWPFWSWRGPQLGPRTSTT